MTDSSEYTAPKVWTWSKPSGGQSAKINRPPRVSGTSGKTQDKLAAGS
jgi:hypothetical protein